MPAQMKRYKGKLLVFHAVYDEEWHVIFHVHSTQEINAYDFITERKPLIENPKANRAEPPLIVPLFADDGYHVRTGKLVK